jgi:hypothetical protein
LTQNIFGIGDQNMPSTIRNSNSAIVMYMETLIHRGLDMMRAADFSFTAIPGR